MRKIRTSRLFPDGSDTFFAPKIKGCFDKRYIIPEFKVKTCEFVFLKSNEQSIKSTDEVSIWLDNSAFIANAKVKKSKTIGIYFSHKKRLRIRIGDRILTEGEMLSLSEQYGCYCYGDFVDYCFALCNEGNEYFKGQIIYWR